MEQIKLMSEYLEKIWWISNQIYFDKWLFTVEIKSNADWVYDICFDFDFDVDVSIYC